MNRLRHLYSFLPPHTLTVIIGCIILYLTLMPDPVPENDLALIPHIDKLVHAIMFGSLAVAIALDRSRSRGLESLTWGFLTLCAVIATVAGGLIELLQGAMAMGRGCDTLDLGADFLGALVAFPLSRPLTRFLR